MPIASIGGVVCCGNISFDMPVWPVETFTWGTTIWVDALEQSIGGNGGNTSTALAILGTPVRLYGCVGRDAHGDQVLSQIAAAGVDISGVLRCDLPTTCTVCVVHPSGDRLFLHRGGASAAVRPEMVRFEDGPLFTHFHLANLYSLPGVRTSAADLLRRAREAGLTTSVDMGWDAQGRWAADCGPCLRYADLVFMNESEALNITGAASADDQACVLRDLGATDIVLKLGARGCAVYFEEQQFAVPAFDVKALDTTGAGDCFAGAFLAAVHRGRSYREAARFANAVGAMSVEQLGTVKGLRPFEETELWMAARSVPPAPIAPTE